MCTRYLPIIGGANKIRYTVALSLILLSFVSGTHEKHDYQNIINITKGSTLQGEHLCIKTTIIFPG